MTTAFVEYFHFAVQRIPSVKLVVAGAAPNLLPVDYLPKLASVQEAVGRNRNAAHFDFSVED
jgi:hypothetical protein